MNAHWRFTILEGVHAGATHELSEGSYSVGSDFDGDIVLLDDGITPRHLRLTLGADGAFLEACDGAPVSINGTALVESRRVTLAEGAVVHCGGLAFRVELPDAPALSAHRHGADQSKATVEPRSAQPARGRRWLVGGPVVAVLLALTTALWQLFHMPAVPREMNAAPRAAALPPALPAGAVPTRDRAALRLSTLPPARDEIVNRVREFVGDENLVVTRGMKGEVVVTGVAHAEGVRRQLQRIQTDYAGTVEIKDEISYVTNKAPRQVQLPQRITDVHVGEVRWFRTADGGRYFEGSLLDDGAEVVSIGLDAIVFRREGRLTEFRPAD